MTREEAIESYKCSNEQAKIRLEVEKMRMDIGEIKELEFYIERDEMAIQALSQEQKSGEWISYYDEDTKTYWYECDRCHAERAFNTDYCPDCGCRMIATQEREE